MHLNIGRRLALVTVLLGAAPPALAAPLTLKSPTLDQLLPAAEAFSLLPVERHGQVLQFSWNIAPGYYLYRQRIRVEVLGPSDTAVQAIELPAGIDHVDEHFGAVQIYRGLLEARVPLQRAPHAPLRVRVGFQGCADVGVCYPPQTVTQTLAP